MTTTQEQNLRDALTRIELKHINNPKIRPFLRCVQATSLIISIYIGTWFYQVTNPPSMLIYYMSCTMVAALTLTMYAYIAVAASLRYRKICLAKTVDRAINTFRGEFILEPLGDYTIIRPHKGSIEGHLFEQAEAKELEAILKESA